MPVGLNLVRFSSRLTNPLWATTAISVVDLGGTTTSPTGRGCRVVYSSTTGDWALNQSVIPEWVPNTQFTLAVWLKQESMPPGTINLVLGDGSGNGVYEVYDFTTTFVVGSDDFGGLPVWSSPGGSITILGGGWSLVSVTGTTPPTTIQTLSVGFNGPAAPVGSSFLCGGFTLYQGTDTTFVDTTSAPRGNQFLPVFPPLYHRVETRYPDNSAVIQFGKGYSFTSAPQGPPQRTFMVTFDALRTFVNTDGTIDTISHPNINMGALEAHYQEVQLYQNFFYDHPNYGRLICRFTKPLVYPRPEAGGFGVQKGVQVELIEIPQ